MIEMRRQPQCEIGHTCVGWPRVWVRSVSCTSSSASIRIILVLLLVHYCMVHVHALSISSSSSSSSPNSSSSSPWRILTVADESDLSLPLNITIPIELAGEPRFAVTSVAGPMFIANASNDYQLSARLILPHSEDDPFGCSPLVHTVTDEGDTLAGAFIMIERGGGCSFTEKVLNVAALITNNNTAVEAVVLFGCTGAPGEECTVNPALNLSPAAFAPFPVTTIYMATADGQLIKSYLLQRRASYMVPHIPVNCNQTQFTSIAAAEAAGCPLPGMSGFVIGTGPLVDPNELIALQLLADSLYFDPTAVDYITWLRAWSDLLVHPEIDPCLSRIVGLWCSRGHVVAIDLSADGVNGTLPNGSLQSLQQLQYLVLLSNAISGPLPNDLCLLTHLITIQVDGNAFTSIPECIGGGTFSNGLSTTGTFTSTVTYPGATSLIIFAGSNNAIMNLPPSFGRLSATLQVLALFNNLITASFPVELFELIQLRQLEVYGNPGLTFDFSTTPVPSRAFGRMTHATSILFQGCGFSGVLPVDAFDGNQALLSLQFGDQISSSGGLSGTLPNMINCTNLALLALQQNSFSGGIPQDWPIYLLAIQALWLTNNQLGDGDMTPLSRLTSLTTLQIASNRITCSVAGDVGQSVWLLLGANVEEAYLDHNNLIGEWSHSNWIPRTLTTLSISYNGITNLPDDLWSSRLVSTDWSFNSLSGPLPSNSPNLSPDPVDLRAPVQSFNVEGNPELLGWPLPDWLQFSQPVNWVVSTDGLFQCQSLSSKSGLAPLQMKVDPTFIAYHNCECIRGSFGIPPDCELLPQTASISPYQLPTSTQVGPNFSNIIAFNETLQPYLVNITGNITNTSISVPFINYPPTITDGWYGENRFTSGINTRWTIDLSEVRATISTDDNDQGGCVTCNNSTANNTQVFLLLNTSSSEAMSMDPVRMITVRLHISRANFTSDCTLEVYSGDSSLQGTRIDLISGMDTDRLQSLPSSTPFTSTSEYQQAYSVDLVGLLDPVILEVDVFSSRATILFDSRSINGLHFIATYSYGFTCPLPLVVSDIESNPSSPACVTPTVGGTLSLIILVAGIGGSLSLFTFGWLIWERYKRHRAEADAEKIQQANSVDPDTLSSTLKSELSHLFASIRSSTHRELVNELLFELFALGSDLASIVLNWSVVGFILAEQELSSFSTISVCYIAVVIVSTFAVGANTVTRIFQIRTINQHLTLEAARTNHAAADTAPREEDERDFDIVDDGVLVDHMVGIVPPQDLQPQSVSNEKEVLINGDDHSASISSVLSLPLLVNPSSSPPLSPELLARTKLSKLERRRLRYGMTILSIFLSSVPFVILNLITLNTNGLVGSTNRQLSLQASLFLASALIGSKLQDLRSYPSVQLQIKRIKLELLQLRTNKLQQNLSQVTKEPNMNPSLPNHSYQPTASDTVNQLTDEKSS